MGVPLQYRHRALDKKCGDSTALSCCRCRSVEYASFRRPNNCGGISCSAFSCLCVVAELSSGFFMCSTVAASLMVQIHVCAKKGEEFCRRGVMSPHSPAEMLN